MTPAQFRTDFPEFSNTTIYPDAQIQFWIDLAGKLLPVDRWDDLLPFGTELFIAHNLTLAIKDQSAAASGGTPGQAIGPASSKAVDKVSVSYDNGLVALENGGAWNLTTYGIRFLQLARMVGAGGVQLGYPGDVVDRLA